VKAEEGPEQQTDSSSVRQAINTLRTAAPAMDHKVGDGGDDDGGDDDDDDWNDGGGDDDDWNDY